MAQVIEHGGPWAGGGFLMWAAHVLRDWFKARKPIEDSTHTVVESFSTLTDKLEHRIAQQERQIEGLRQENHSVRNDLQKVRGYADAVLRWAVRLEDQVRGAGMQPEPRPELPILG